MKAFLEEYGFVILIAIVIILLIVMATPVGNSIKASILGLVDRFSGTATSKLDKADQGDFTANLRQATSDVKKVSLDMNSDSTTDEYKYMVTYVQGGKTLTKGADAQGNPSLGPIKNITLDIAFGAKPDSVTDPTTNFTRLNDIDPDNGSTLYVTVLNVGTNEIVQSNSIKYHQ